MSVTTMFLRDITCLDHALIYQDGSIKGGSYHVDVEIEGEVDPTEQVVVDFSSVKKLLKTAIDHPIEGYDHKLWTIPGFSGCEVNENEVVSRALNIKHAANSVIQFRVMFLGTLKETVERELEVYLLKSLQDTLGSAIKQVRVEVNEAATTRHQNVVPFRYIHGLKHSTSYGCQNLSHGHLSFVEWTHTDKFRSDCFSCQSGVQQLMMAIDFLDNAVMIARENIVDKTDSSITVAYNSLRGSYEATYDTRFTKVIIFDKETTIENITLWFKEQFRGTLEMAHVDKLYISEGLSKGSCVTID